MRYGVLDATEFTSIVAYFSTLLRNSYDNRIGFMVNKICSLRLRRLITSLNGIYQRPQPHYASRLDYW